MSTIVGVATPPGLGGLAVLRLSGPEAWTVALRYFRPVRAGLRPQAGRFFFGHLHDEVGREVDEAILLLFAGPHSYTAEDVAEVQVHGGVAVVEEALRLFRSAGLEAAAPGEFTRRAFENGRIDLSQAEAVADLIAARSLDASRLALRNLTGGLGDRIRDLRGGLKRLVAELEAALDFPEEVAMPDAGSVLQALRTKVDDLVAGYETGRRIQEGMRVVLLGQPNAGKSSLLNALVGRERAITSSQPGTTRDLIEAELRWEGRVIHLVDTAGLGSGEDPVEAEGQRRALAEAASADLILWVVPAGREEVEPAPEGALVWEVRQKSDLHPGDTTGPRPGAERFFRVSALTGQGLGELRTALTTLIGWDGEVLLGNERQRAALLDAQAALERAAVGWTSLSPDLLASDLWGAWEVLGEITGESGRPEVLDEIFSRFCLGK